MWVLQFLPDSFILYVVYCAMAAGAIGIITSYIIKFIPFINIYRTPIQIISIVIFCAGVYWYGGYANEMAWRARVAEMEAKIAEAEQKSQKANEEIQNKVVEKTKIVREKGKTQIEYINRLVEGKTVEIVKDMSEEQKKEFLAKQKELQDALKNCPVPRIIVEEHNKAADQK
jgi:hypothetical protein